MAALAPEAAARESWHAPVAGPVTKPFELGDNPFAPGDHRGADFAAAPGTPVHAACSGRVVVAGRVGTSGRLVTIACGPWRATHMPLATIAVRRGATVRRGAELGTVAPSSTHAGVHLGARRAGARFGYVDPLRLIGGDHPPPAPPAAPHRVPRGPVASRPARARARPEYARPPIAAPRVSSPPLAPWPAWAGLAALLAGAIGTGVGMRARAPARGPALARAVSEEAA
jgi:hypothetical protein